MSSIANSLATQSVIAHPSLEAELDRLSERLNSLALSDHCDQNKCISLNFFDRPALSNSHLILMGKLTHLVSVNVGWNTSINDDGVKHLATLTNLSYLSLCCTKVTDNGLLALATLVNLNELCVAGCDLLTDKGLEVTDSYPLLRKLDISFCPLLNGAFLVRLKERNPAPVIIMNFCVNISAC